LTDKKGSSQKNITEGENQEKIDFMKLKNERLTMNGPGQLG
jgi:hypothetical protein